MLRRRRSGAPVRRGAFFPLIPTTPALPAPERPPDEIRQSSRRTPALRRGRFFATALVVVAQAPSFVPPFISNRQHPTPIRRRGRFTPVPTPPLPPRGMVRADRPIPQLRRRRRFDPPWAVVVAAPPHVPATIRQSAHRLLPFRRGDLFTPPWPAITPPVIPEVPPRLVRRSRPALFRRTGRLFPVPESQLVVAPIRRTRRPAPVFRCGKFHEPPWPFISPPGPQDLPPARIVARPRRVFPVRGVGRLYEPPWVGAEFFNATSAPTVTESQTSTTSVVGAGTSTPVVGATNASVASVAASRSSAAGVSTSATSSPAVSDG